MENNNSVVASSLNTTIIQPYVMVYVVIYGISAVIGTFGNLLVIVVTVSEDALRKSQNAFIVSLAVADLMVSSVTMPESIAGVLMGKKYFDDRYTLCAFSMMMCAPGCVASMHSMMWISASRYFYICKYQVYVQYFTKARIAIYISSIWLISFGAHMFNYMGWGRPHYSQMLKFCSPEVDLHSYGIFYACTLLVAIIIAFVFYLKIYLVLRKSKLSKALILGNGHHGNESDKKGNSDGFKNEIKIMKTSFKILLLFFCTWLPLSLAILVGLDERVPEWAYLYAGLLAHCNSTLNFIVYFSENKLFRSSAKKCFVKSLKLAHVNVSTDIFNSRVGPSSQAPKVSEIVLVTTKDNSSK